MPTQSPRQLEKRANEADDKTESDLGAMIVFTQPTDTEKVVIKREQINFIWAEQVTEYGMRLAVQAKSIRVVGKFGPYRIGATLAEAKHFLEHTNEIVTEIDGKQVELTVTMVDLAEQAKRPGPQHTPAAASGPEEHHM